MDSDYQGRMETGLEAEEVVAIAVSVCRVKDPSREGATGRFAGQLQGAKRVTKTNYYRPRSRGDKI